MRFEELSSREVDRLDRDRTVIVLPLGSVEQHGHHMPLGTDTMLAHAVSLAAANKLAGGVCGAAAALVWVLGPSYALCRQHQPETRDAHGGRRGYRRKFAQHGFKRILLVNGHGGNAGVVDVLASVLGHKHYGKARIAGLTYFQLARAGDRRGSGSPTPAAWAMPASSRPPCSCIFGPSS